MAIILKNNRAERLRAWRAQEKMIAKREPALRRQVIEEFRNIGYRAVIAINTGKSLEYAFQSHREHLKSILEAHYKKTSAEAKKNYLKPLQKAYPSFETKNAENVFSATFSAWVSRYALKKAEEISYTTRRLIRKVITDAEQEGLSIQEIAKNIRTSTAGLMGRARAVTIARTETHAAANASNDLLGSALNLGERINVWTSGDDDRVRPSHSAVDGQEYKAGSTIRVGDSELKYPGDPNGSPEEVVNCRCNVQHLYPGLESVFGRAEDFFEE